jgi:hypothetical protein
MRYVRCSTTHRVRQTALFGVAGNANIDATGRSLCVRRHFRHHDLRRARTGVNND